MAAPESARPGGDLNLILNLKELWRRRALVGAAVFAAAAITVLAIYQVSLLPPSIAKRAEVEAQGSIDLLVDSTTSPIADARRDLAGLTARAGVFAQLMAGGRVVGQMARESGIRAREIDVAGPQPLPGEAPGVEEAPQVHPYGIAITQQTELPILSVVTRAPTVAEARALAAAAPRVIRREVEAVQRRQGTALAKRVEFRALGQAQAAPVDESPGEKLALALFVFLVGISVALILAGPRFLAAWRSAEPEPPPAEPRQRPAKHSPALLLPADLGEDEDDGDPETGWVGQRRAP